MIQQEEYGPLYPLQSEEQTATHQCSERRTITRLQGPCDVLIKEETRLVIVHQHLVHILQVEVDYMGKYTPWCIRIISKYLHVLY